MTHIARRKDQRRGLLGQYLKPVLLSMLAFSALLLTAQSALAANAAAGRAFYKGKTITIIVPTSPGGHFDRFARLVAHFLPDHLPVKDVKVVNRPGGGMLIAANKVYHAKPDGLTIGIANAAGYVFAQLAHEPGVNYDVSRFDWIGRPDDDPVVLSTHKNGPFKSFDDLVALKGTNKTVKGLAVGRGGFAYNTEVIVFNAFHIPFHMIAAFKGSHQLVASYLSGNGDVIPLSASSTIQHLAAKSTLLTVVSDHSIPQLKHVPTIMTEARKHHVTGSDKKVLQTLIHVLGLGRAFYAPPGVPADRLAALRSAFKATIKDPKARAQGAKSGLFLGYMPPHQLKERVHEALTTRRALLTKYLKQN